MGQDLNLYHHYYLVKDLQEVCYLNLRFYLLSRHRQNLLDR